MLTVRIPNNKLKKLTEAVEKASKKLPREMATVINAVAKKTRTAMSKQVREELAATAASVNKTLKQSRKATPGTLGATVTLNQTSRIPLRDFGARQNNSGVSYKISKTGGRKTVAGAFQGPKPGLMKASWRGRVFKRTGKARLPIQQLFGPSAWGVYVIGKMEKTTKQDAKQELSKQMDRRIRFLLLKASGEI